MSKKYLASISTSKSACPSNCPLFFRLCSQNLILFPAVISKNVTVKNLLSIYKCDNYAYKVCRSKGCKVTSCQSWRSQKKVCHLAPATLEPVSPSSTASGIKSFSKFDRQQLCSPLTYRPHIYSIKRSKTFKKVCQISRLCCLLLDPLWQLKVPPVYFINGQKGGLACSSLYMQVFLYLCRLSE